MIKIENLKFYRNRKGLTLQELSNKTGLSISMLSQIESGVRDTTTEKLKLIAKSLECSSDELLGLEVR